MKENWYALLISIVKGISPEAAFLRMYRRSKVGNSSKVKKTTYEIFPDDEVAKMVELKKTMTYKAIAEIYNTKDRNIYYHIKRYRPELIKTGVFDCKTSRRGKNTYGFGF